MKTKAAPRGSRWSALRVVAATLIGGGVAALSTFLALLGDATLREPTSLEAITRRIPAAFSLFAGGCAIGLVGFAVVSLLLRGRWRTWLLLVGVIPPLAVLCLTALWRPGEFSRTGSP